MSKQPLILAIAGLLETSPSQTEDIAIYGERITSILSHYDFTYATSLAAAEALADALSIEEEEQEVIGVEHPTPAIIDLAEGSLTPFPPSEWERASDYDLRFARGDDYAADGWRHITTGRITRTVVGSGAPTSENDTNTIHPAYIQNPIPPHILKESPLMALIEQSDLFD
jgi:hypothetical protein